MIIGIDLGTTFSVLAVSGRVALVEGYPPPIYLDELDVTIIPDPYGNPVIPSAVWVDPDEPGTLVVGADARDRVDDVQAPILGSKRTIGTNIGHRLLDREYSAREVATIILTHLKDVAEQALGEPVDRAVITHPAFFEGAMLRETAEAASAAGFAFEQDTHLMMEPTAAALAYTGVDTRDPLRVLTYDLGGGTFDITVLERRGGVATMKAHGGDRLLGGYTFDRRLARWLYDRLREKGVRITVDDENQSRHATWTRLLQIAEDTKHKLADARTDLFPVPIKARLTDDDGRSVTLIDKITRTEYVALIQDLLDATLDGRGGPGETKGCELTLTEAGLTIEEIDEILLVGGSCWGPWVSETIRARWDRDTRLLEPDRIVAAGAALQARSLPVEVPGEGCTVHLDVEPRSPQETITVAGRVEADTTTPLTITMTDDSGVSYTATRGEGGRFAFEDVELRPGATTTFTLIVGEGELRTLAEHTFTVEQVEDCSDGDSVGIMTVLPKPLFIEKADGMEPLAEEGATLPVRKQLDFHRTNDFDDIEIRLFQEHLPIGSVVISDVPRDVGRGAAVTLTVEVSRNNTIEGHATVHTRNGAVVREATVHISIPRMEIPSLAEMRDDLADLEAELEERMALEPDPTARMLLRAEGDRRRRKARRLIDDPVPDRQELWLALRALGRIVWPPRDDLEPPLVEFESLVLRIRDVIASRGSDPNIKAHERTLSRLESDGRAAHARRQTKRWARSCEGLRRLLGRIAEPPPPPPPGEDEIPATADQKDIVVMQLDQSRQELRAKEAELMDRGDFDRYRTRTDRIRVRIDDVHTRVEQVPDDTSPRAALNQLKNRVNEISQISTAIRQLEYDIT